MGKKGKGELIKELEKLLGTFSDDMITALDIKSEKKSLLKKIRDLKKEELHLKDMVEDLEAARNKQAAELKKKAVKEAELKQKIDQFKEETADMESEKITLNQQIKELKQEREELNASLERTNDLLVRFRHHIQEFDQSIKS